LTRFFSIVVLVAGLNSPMEATQMAVEVVHRVSLLEQLAPVADARFDGETHLVLTVGKLGVVRVSYDGSALGVPEVLVPENPGAGVVLAENLAVSASHLAVASPASQMAWQRRQGEADIERLGNWDTPETAPISYFEDIDLRGDRLAVLGLMRSDRGMSPDGAIAWTTTLGSDPPKLEPLAWAKAGKGARPFDACGGFLVGRLRFLDDGRLLVVPGAEPGIYLYSADGRLERTWDTAHFGIDLRCDFDDETMVRLGGDAAARHRYLAGFTTVDEILSTSAGPALVVREVAPKRTRWSLLLLPDTGVPRRIDLPIESTSPRAHLRGDAKRDRMLLILKHYMAQPDEGSELFELRLGRSMAKKSEAVE
jgi:hypothetical protein